MEYLKRCITGLLTAGLIILAIPVLFFSVGKTIEKEVSKREVDRYFRFWCDGLIGSLIPRELILEGRKVIEQSLDSEEQKKKDLAIRSINSDLLRKAYGWCFTLMLILVVTANILAFAFEVSFLSIWLEAIIGTILFAMIEISIVVIMFNRYCPLDVNNVNKTIVERLRG